MKTILCYGDSLTYGAIPLGGRHPYEDRWPTALEAAIGPDKVRVIAEGLGGRTTVFDDFTHVADRNGAKVLPTLIGSHFPLDCVVIMLGTNDLKPYINGTAIGAALGVKRLVEIVRTFPYGEGIKVPEVVVVAPPLCIDTDVADLQPMLSTFIEQSKEFAGHYQRIANDLGCAFFDAASVAKPDSVDGVHLDAANTRAIGEGVAPVVKQVLGL